MTPYDRMIVLEGTDGVGKSTVAELLRQKLGVDVFHEGPPPAGVHPYDHYLNAAKSPAIFDRFHLGEIVYGACSTRGTRMNPDSLTDLDERLRAGHELFTVVLVAAKHSTLTDHLMRKHEGAKNFAAFPENDRLDVAWRNNLLFTALSFTPLCDLALAVDSLTPNAIANAIVDEVTR